MTVVSMFCLKYVSSFNFAFKYFEGSEYVDIMKETCEMLNIIDFNKLCLCFLPESFAKY